MLLCLVLQMEYSTFNKDFYEEHTDIANLTRQEVFDLKKKLGLKVSESASRTGIFEVGWVWSLVL